MVAVAVEVAAVVMVVEAVEAAAVAAEEAVVMAAAVDIIKIINSHTSSIFKNPFRIGEDFFCLNHDFKSEKIKEKENTNNSKKY
jgi:hypothetical protein